MDIGIESRGSGLSECGAELLKPIITRIATKGTKTHKPKKPWPVSGWWHFCLCVFVPFVAILGSLTLFQREPYSGRSLESEFDEQWMRLALNAAREAQAAGEVPIGTCIVSENKLVAVCGNRTRTDCDPTAHAEIVALREAASKLGNYRLPAVDVYSTIEPCAMCAGALIQARVRRLIYGAPDERAGAVTSRFRICDTDFLNHRIEISAGVLEAECRALMQEFFQTRRGRIVD